MIFASCHRMRGWYTTTTTVNINYAVSSVMGRSMMMVVVMGRLPPLLWSQRHNVEGHCYTVDYASWNHRQHVEAARCQKQAQNHDINNDSFAQLNFTLTVFCTSTQHALCILTLLYDMSFVYVLYYMHVSCALCTWRRSKLLWLLSLITRPQPSAYCIPGIYYSSNCNICMYVW